MLTFVNSQHAVWLYMLVVFLTFKDHVLVCCAARESFHNFRKWLWCFFIWKSSCFMSLWLWLLIEHGSVTLSKYLEKQTQIVGVMACYFLYFNTLINPLFAHNHHPLELFVRDILPLNHLFDRLICRLCHAFTARSELKCPLLYNHICLITRRKFISQTSTLPFDLPSERSPWWCQVSFVVTLIVEHVEGMSVKEEPIAREFLRRYELPL